MAAVEPIPVAQLSAEQRRWLHDKYEQLGEEEGQLAGTRTSYFAAIGAVLVTGLVVVIANLLSKPLVLVAALSFLAGFGIMVSTVWAVLLHRTTVAQTLWREAALKLEEIGPPISLEIPASISFHRGATRTIDLARPYHVHKARFASEGLTSWFDRVNPWTLTEVMPMTLVAIWSITLVAAWYWFLFLQ